MAHRLGKSLTSQRKRNTTPDPAAANQPHATPPTPDDGHPSASAATAIRQPPPGGFTQVRPRLTSTPHHPARPRGLTSPRGTRPAPAEQVRLCRDAFRQDKPEQALRCLDTWLLNTTDPGAVHALLSELDNELVQHLVDGSATGLRDCPGIGQAVRLLARAGWWLGGQPAFVEPRIREGLLALADPASVAEALALELDLWLTEAADACGQRLSPADTIEHLQGRLSRLLDLMRKPQAPELAALVLGLALRLLDRLDHPDHVREGLGDALKPACIRLIQACLSPESLRAFGGLRSRLRAQATVDDAGHWTWTALEYASDTPSGPSQAELKHQPVLLAPDIDRLLQGPRPVPWALVMQAMRQVMKLLHWVPDFRVWLSWSLHEAARGNPAPMLGYIAKMEQELDANQARTALYLCLLDRLKAGRPWSEIAAIAQAAHEHHGLALHADEEWSLRLQCADSGDAGPLTDCLQSPRHSQHLGREQLSQALSLCERNSLPANARAAVLIALRPLLGIAPELRKRLEALESSPASRPGPLAAPTSASPLEELVRARAAVTPWFSIDASRPGTFAIRLAAGQKPRTPEGQQALEAALFTWMDVELLQGAKSWQELLACIDHIETSWGLRIDRERLLRLCMAHARRANYPKALLDHLPKLNDAPPSTAALLELLDLIGSRDPWSPVIRASLIRHLLNEARARQHTGLLAGCARAMLALPDTERQACIGSYLSALGPDETLARLFDSLAQQQGKAPPPWVASLRSLPQASATTHWIGWLGLCRALCHAIGPRVWASLQEEQADHRTAQRLFDALAHVATPASGELATAVPPLFDLLDELCQSLPQDQRAAFLRQLQQASLGWPGAPALQAALRGALQVLMAQASGQGGPLPPQPRTTQPAIDEAATLCAHGFQWQSAVRQGDEPLAQARQLSLRQRWDTALFRSHSPGLAAPIAQAFGLSGPH